MSLPRTIALAPIRFYQRFISPGLPPRCKYAPTCSAYAVRAIEVHGIIKGTLLASWRLLRCNPWSNGGVDHVPLQGQWSAPPWVPPDDWAGYLDPDDFPVMGLSDCDESPSCTHDTIDETCAHSPVRDTHEGDVHVV